MNRSSGNLSSTLLNQLQDDDDYEEKYQKDVSKASRRAIELMMRNIKSKQKPVWVPQANHQNRIFHENYLIQRNGRSDMPLQNPQR